MAGRPAGIPPQWIRYSLQDGKRLPDAFTLRNQVKAALLDGVDKSLLKQAKRANELDNDSRDGQFLELYLRIFLENRPVMHERRMEDWRLGFLRFFEAFKYGDMEQALILFNNLNLNMYDRFHVSLILGNHLLRYGILEQAYTYYRRALHILEHNHTQFFTMRGRDKRDFFRYTVLSIAEIHFKQGQYHKAFGFLSWLGTGDLLEVVDPVPCTWQQILDRKCSPAPAEMLSDGFIWYRGDPESLSFHLALAEWGQGWGKANAAFDGFLARTPDSIWADAVRTFLVWLKNNPAP